MKFYAALGLTAVLAGLGATGAHAQGSIYVYNFNDGKTGSSAANTANLFRVDRANQGAKTSGSSLSSTFAPANITSFGGTTVNADGTDVSGQALALQNNANNGAYLQASADLTGFQSVGFSFATQRTSTGFTGNQFQYSTDGFTFTNFDPAYTPATGFAAQSFNLSGIAGLNNNANAAFRVVFNGGTSAGGNNRLDNLIISGSQIPMTAPVPEASTTVSLGLLLALGGLAFADKKKKANVSL